MAEQALSTGSTTRRRVLFGLLAADGWAWASLKAVFWFVLIILILGYLPDRAYYFTVFPTIDLGVNPATAPSSYVTPINFCPASNADLPCPAPDGSVVPWQVSPKELALPGPRTDGALVQVGSKLLFIGGSDGKTASADVYVAEIVGGSSFDKWKSGPALPEPRAGAAVAFTNGAIYVIGGTDAAGKPTKTVYELDPNTQTGDLGQWKTVDAAALPAARTAAAVAVTSDGLVLVGGNDGTGPTATVWKSDFDSKGALTAWAANAPLIDRRQGALAAQIGDFLWVYGGSGSSGPSTIVQRGSIVTPPAPSTPNATQQPSSITQWAVQAQGAAVNLPEPRSDAAGFVSNGTLYLIGGTDGTQPQGQVYWAVPDANGDIAGWQHLVASDLPSQGLAGAAAAISGSTAFLVGGTTSGGVIDQAVRSNLSPALPFFQLGLVGATVPGLAIQGEIGQQLGYLNAAGVGTADFIILLLIGYAFAHREKTRAFVGRILRRRRRA
jgi:N-acetylneuraminic acid mutarotase